MKRLREIAEAATPGPWRDVGDRGVGGDPGEFVVFPFDGHYGGTEIQQDATYIATFDPTTVLALLDVAEAAGVVLGAHDYADDEQDWTGPAVDLLLRDALKGLQEVLA